MFSFDGMNTVFYLKDKSLQLYSEKLKGKYLSLNFPQEVINNLEIKDTERFKDLLISWLTQSEIGKQKAVIVLSEEVLFTKHIPIGAKDLPSQVEDFINEIPFEPEMVAKTYFQTEDGYALVATNKQLFENIKGILEELEWSVVGVTPSLIYGDFGKTDQLSQEELEEIFKQPGLLKDINYLAPKDLKDLMSLKPLEDNNQDKEETIEVKGNGHKKVWILLVALVFLGGSLLTVFNLGLVKFPFIKTDSASVPLVVQPTTSPVEEPTSTPETSVDKKELKVQVLNGTGIPGQAGEVKDLLVDLGFEGIGTANAPEKVTEAAVDFSTKVPQSIQDEVLAELEKTFIKVWSRNGMENSGYDISVTTGKYRENQ